MTQKTILVTGGAGFIGANFIRQWIASEKSAVVNLDKLTYAGNLSSLKDIERLPRYEFVRADIGDFDAVTAVLSKHRPEAIVNFAAESHVDRSIHGPAEFVNTNLLGTFQLLEAARGYWSTLPDDAKSGFRFLHVSTDEVYGSLSPDESPFTEKTGYAPNSPYSASKAGSDHLVRAYHHTYGLPTEKLIPLVISNALAGKALPVYGDGMNVRDWLYVGDHCAAIRLALAKGRVGETYNIGGNNERTNIDVVRTICHILDELRPRHGGPGYESLVKFVADRPGHDRRYAIDASKSNRELGWSPGETFESGIRKTVQWYLDNADWVRDVISGDYRKWMETNYARREAK